MRALGLIPARGGSKGIPRKNLAPLGGRPLLQWTCEAARASRRLSRTVLSTDDPEIREAGRSWGVEAPFVRPAELAADETPMIDVVLHAVRAVEAGGPGPDVIVLLQPTSPFRRAEHIDACVARLEETGCDTVVSVVGVPHRFGPGSLMKLEGERLVPVAPLVLRRQEKERLYARNGPAVLGVRREVALSRGTLYGDDCRPLVMNEADSVDIDDPLDLAWAEFLLARREGGRC